MYLIFIWSPWTRRHQIGHARAPSHAAVSNRSNGEFQAPPAMSSSEIRWAWRCSTRSSGGSPSSSGPSTSTSRLSSTTSTRDLAKRNGLLYICCSRVCLIMGFFEQI